MKKAKWSNLFGTALAGATVAGVMISANKLAEKYGEKPVGTKLVNLNLAKTVEYAIDKFVNTDDDKLIRITNLLSKQEKTADAQSNTEELPEVNE